jgi:hypothetical protein
VTDKYDVSGFAPETIAALCQKAMRERDEADDQLAAKDAEIERLTRERDEARAHQSRTLAKNRRALTACIDAIRQRDALKEALEKVKARASEPTVDHSAFWHIAWAALASLDQPADATKGEKRD